jgi:mono/diheme cytochrome c family protein
MAAILVLAGAVVLWTGAYSFAADAPHSPPVSSMIEFARERSVRVRADDVKVPSLAAPELVTKGAGNYQAMCAQCHQAPGDGPTELSRGLYPSPPALTREAVEPAAAFWTIKHGIKSSGMPAWGSSMQDADIWSLVAFLQKLPSMDQAAYREIVEQSGGHSHGGAPGPVQSKAPASQGAGHGQHGGNEGKPAH